MTIRAKVRAAGVLDLLTRFGEIYYPYARKAHARTVGAFTREYRKFLADKLTRSSSFTRGKLSFQFEVKPDNERSGKISQIRASIFTTHPAAQDLEFGAVKRPKRAGGRLAIPWGYAYSDFGEGTEKTRRVKPQFRRGPEAVRSGYETERRDGSKRQVKGRTLRLIVKGDDSFLAVRLRGKNKAGGRRYVRAFLLLKQIRIDPKLEFFERWRQFQPEAERREREEHERFAREVLGPRRKR